MSIRVMSRVWEKSTQKGSALLLLLAIADHAADDGYCWPGIPVLAKKIRMSERSVMRLVKQIEEDGELYVIRSNRNNRYVVTVGMRQSNLDAVARSRGFPLPEYPSDDLSRDTGDEPGDTHVTSEVTQSCHPNLHEPSMNHHEDTELFPAGDPKEEPTTTDKPITEFKDYLSMSAEVHKRTGGAPSSTIPAAAGGADPYLDGPLTAACAILRITPEVLDEQQQRNYAKRIRKIVADIQGGTPELFTQACQAWSNHGPKWKGKESAPYPDVFAKGFGIDMSNLMRQILSGTISGDTPGWSKGMS